MRCILVGNYGVGNFGDEALRQYFVKAYPEVTWQVLSAHPQANELARLPGGIRSLFFTSWWKTVQAVRSCDAVIFGGGTLFTDSESVYACFLWWLHARLASFFGKPVLFAAQGIGPWHSRVGEWFSRDALRHGVFISVRDKESAQRIEQFRLNTKIIQTFDPVFLFLAEDKLGGRSQKVLTVIPRSNTRGELPSLMAQECQTQGIERIVILSFQPDDSRERDVCTSLQKRSSVSCEIHAVRTLQDLQQSLRLSSFVLTERFHGAIAALAMDIPFHAIPQATGDKLDALGQLITDGTSKEALLGQCIQGENELRIALSTLVTL